MLMAIPTWVLAELECFKFEMLSFDADVFTPGVELKGLVGSTGSGCIGVVVDLISMGFLF